MRLTLLVRSYCHLCDEMLAALATHAGATPVDVIDVDAPEHAALEADFGEAVPVLFAGPVRADREISRYRLDPARLRAVLSGADAIR